MGELRPGVSFEKGSPLARLIDRTTVHKFQLLRLPDDPDGDWGSAGLPQWPAVARFRITNPS